MESDQDNSVEEEDVTNWTDQIPVQLQTPTHNSSSDEFVPSDSEASEHGKNVKSHTASGVAVRRRRPSLSDDTWRRNSPSKRSAYDVIDDRPLKRTKGPLNTKYLDLLNHCIEDAAQRFLWEDHDAIVSGSQIGLSDWSADDKRNLFAAMDRLGKHDLAGIASRIPGKSVLHVSQYIRLLQKAEELLVEKQRRFLPEVAEFPAAVELSQDCCDAEEEAADTISLQQEQREQRREKRKWGENWLITSGMAGEIEGDRIPASAGDPAFFSFFQLSNWLRLSERFFMNSTFVDENWVYVDSGEPSVWATAFDDFHSLAVSLTRRLVQTTLFVTMSRIRSKNELRRNVKPVISRKDVEAAVLSLGLAPNAKQFWMKSARRLHLDVHEKYIERGQRRVPEPMSYDAVEAALKVDLEAGWISDDTSSVMKQESSADELSEDSSKDVVESVEEPGGAGGVFGQSSEDGSTSDKSSEADPDDDSESGEEREIDAEMREIIEYSAVDFRKTSNARSGIRSRILRERQQEQQAESRDQWASWQAEKQMWELLQRQPPAPLIKPEEPGPLVRSSMSLDGLIQGKKEWSAGLQYLGQWETQRSEED